MNEKKTHIFRNKWINEANVKKCNLLIFFCCCFECDFHFCVAFSFLNSLFFFIPFVTHSIRNNKRYRFIATDTNYNSLSFTLLSVFMQIEKPIVVRGKRVHQLFYVSLLLCEMVCIIVRLVFTCEIHWQFNITRID